MTPRTRGKETSPPPGPRAPPARSASQGSYKGGPTPAPATVAPTVEVRLIFASGFEGREPTSVSVSPGSPLKALLQTLGLPPEGTVLFWNGEPVPSDLPVPGPGDLEIVRSFSGG